MATHSSVLAWRIPGTGEPGGLPSMGSQRVGHNWSDLAAAAEVYSIVIHNSKGYTPFILILKCWYIPWVVQYIIIAYFPHNCLYILIPYSCIAPSPFLLFVTASLFSISESVSFLLYSLLCYIFYTHTNLYSTYKWYHTVFLFLRIISLSIITSKFIHVVAISFFFTDG